MLDRALIVEYWQESDGRYVAEALHHPIAETAESLDQLRDRVGDSIRAVFLGEPTPSVYDFRPRGYSSARPHCS